ncbi:MAG: type 1 glutamine amidotransferase [Bdellovibrionota bacterium]
MSARFLKQSPNEFGIGGKPLQYLEQNMANALARAGALVFLIPSIGTATELSPEHFRPEEYARELDGLLLQGGVDVCPSAYGEAVTAENVVTDPIRDRYELALIQQFHSMKKPVLGVCRGMQLINVFFGGTLHQDIPSHYCSTAREGLEHEVRITKNSYLDRLYKSQSGKVNSIHHQSVKKLGNGLVIEAVSPEDGVVEAIRYTGDSYVMGVQWHPEFHQSGLSTALEADVLFEDFVKTAQFSSNVSKSPLAKVGF